MNITKEQKMKFSLVFCSYILSQSYEAYRKVFSLKTTVDVLNPKRFENTLHVLRFTD